MSSINHIKRDIRGDIEKIDNALKEQDSSLLKSIHMEMDGKYQARIEKWGLGQFQWRESHGFYYNSFDLDELRHNLQNMKGKLLGYLQVIELNPLEANSHKETINYYNKNETNIVNQNINVNFNNIEDKIKECESLTDEETKEALKMLNELKTIYESDDCRKVKWEKAKKILGWLLDKSVDIAASYFPVIVSMLSKQ